MFPDQPSRQHALMAQWSIPPVRSVPVADLPPPKGYSSTRYESALELLQVIAYCILKSACAVTCSYNPRGHWSRYTSYSAAPSATLQKGVEEQENVKVLLKLPALQHQTLPAHRIF